MAALSGITRWNKDSGFRQCCFFVTKSVYYNHGLRKIEEIILNIIVATRYSRCGKKISEQFKKRLDITISKAKMLNLQEYGLMEAEIAVFNEEIEEVEALIVAE